MDKRLDPEAIKAGTPWAFEEWRTGVTLLTAQTRRWTKEQTDANEDFENHCIFARFTGADEGRYRQLIAVCETREQARLIVDVHNAMLEKLRAIAEAPVSEHTNPFEMFEMYHHAQRWLAAARALVGGDDQ